MNHIVYKRIMELEGATMEEAREIWEDELSVVYGDIFEALATFGLEPDVVI